MKCKVDGIHIYQLQQQSQSVLRERVNSSTDKTQSNKVGRKTLDIACDRTEESFLHRGSF
jgi:hypothetical protein